VDKRLMRGNHALGEAAILGGCQCYFGYPITPQNELTEYMAENMHRVPDGVFIQSESEIAAINMVLGASVTGKRAMTSSSSPGISLKQEGISFLAASELPAVIANVVRGGPGLGNIAPAQSDYFQATRGGGHGDYRTIVLAPSSVQEMADFTMDAFDLADIYRTPVIILADGLIGQMMEPLIFRENGRRDLPPKDWILDGAEGRPSRFIRSLLLDVLIEEEHNWKLQRKYKLIAEKEVQVEISDMDDAKLAIVAYGTAARIAKGAVKNARGKGMKVGLFRPQTLWPFPSKEIREVSRSVKHFLVFEMSCGQMIEDVQLSLQGQGTVSFFGRPGGVLITPSDLLSYIQREYHKIRGRK
jgi:2-oxoglutarate ferredoxin oxidoreductase subunit alpha